MSQNHPIDKIRFGRIAVAIWENTSSEGKRYHNFTVERTYTDAEGKTQSKASFDRNDLLTLAEALLQAFSRSYELVAESKQLTDA